MSPTFNQIPNNLRVPLFYAEFDNSRAVQGPALQEYKALLIGQITAAATMTPDLPYRVTSADQVSELAGIGSTLHGMAQAWFSSNKFTPCYIIGLEDADGSTALDVELTATGTSTAAGAAILYIAGRRIVCAVPVGSTAAEAIALLESSINSVEDCPMSADSTGAVLTLSAKNAGLVGNDIDVRVDYNGETTSLPGLTFAITDSTAGATNPSIADAITSMADTWFNIIVLSLTDTTNLDLMNDELEGRFGPMRMIDGFCFISKRASHSALTTFGDSLNYKLMSCMEATDEPRTPYEVAAETAALAAYYGNIDPARPFQTLAYTWRMPKNEEQRFTLEERNQLLFDGISTSYVDAGGIVRIERLITLYQVNAYDVADISYLDVNTLLTLSYIRFDFRAMVTTKYPRHKLANDGTVFATGQPIMTPKLMKSECIAKFRQWEQMGLVEGIDQFKNDLVVERNAQDPNRLDVLLPPDLVNQLVIVATQIQFLL